MIDNTVFFIAEVGNNHNGDINRAKRLILAAKSAGCHAVKFQMRDIPNLYRRTDNLVEDLGVEYTRSLIDKYELNFDQHLELFNFCKTHSIEYFCTPWDLPSVDILEEMGVARYKVASADFDNIPLIDRLIETGKPLIFSTGMSSTDDIKARVKYLKAKAVEFSILHCNSTYPAPFHDIELNFISYLKSFVDSVGYSGHERGIAVSLAAIALGASIIERHITEDKGLEGPDHQASLLPAEFQNLTSMAQEILPALGGREIKERKLSQGAKLNREVLGKSVVAAHELRAGTVLVSDDLLIRSPGQGLPPTRLPDLIGRTVTRTVKSGDFISEMDFENPQEKDEFNLGNLNWGVPVRPHDVSVFHEIFNAPVYEFHISFSDLDRPLPNEDWTFLQTKKVLVHAPELFWDSKLLDLCDLENQSIHINNLNRVCDFCRKISEKIGNKNPVNIIANVGGFSTHKFRERLEAKKLYDSVSNSLSILNEDGCCVTIQNMAPFPWHFGGQRYQNIFLEPSEIVDFCLENSRTITLDTAHLSMFCTYSGYNFLEALKVLNPVVTHWHISDAIGLNGEGVKLGDGNVPVSELIHFIRPGHTFIVETWQGHTHRGLGFKEELKYLEMQWYGK